MLRLLVTHLLHFEFFLRDRQRLSTTVYSTQQPTVAQWRMKRMILVRGPDWPRAHYSESPHPAAHSPRLVYLLLVQSHIPKSCLSACMRGGTDEGDGVVGDKGANATLHHCCNTVVITAAHTCARRPLLLCAQAPPGTARHATCASSRNLTVTGTRCR
ncbi:hypothetical protein EDB85DRAFT_1397020 [Lactarius pseudohatsudake]|nr:hypothetical protein EDB85DRAFT_1397020 [Lactarius pseudohatsudake]